MKSLHLACTCLLALSGSVCFGQSSGSDVTTDAAKTAKQEKRFSKMDRNSDTFVDREEFTQSRIAKKKPERAEKRFARMDKNGDGKLAKDEWSVVSGRKHKARNKDKVQTRGYECGPPESYRAAPEKSGRPFEIPRCGCPPVVSTPPAASAPP
jgi:hypothetical protein